MGKEKIFILAHKKYLEMRIPFRGIAPFFDKMAKWKSLEMRIDFAFLHQYI
jgi:hypothetical protein